MEREYLRVGAPLLVIAKEQFLLTGAPKTVDTRAVTIKIGAVLGVNYQSHLISDDIIQTLPPNLQLPQPRIALLATLVVCVNYEAPADNWLNKTVTIPLNKVVVLEPAQDRVSANWFVAPAASFDDVAKAVAGYPMHCATENWYDTVRPSQRFSHVGHASQGFARRGYSSTEGWFHDPVIGGWGGWGGVPPGPANSGGWGGVPPDLVNRVGKSFDQSLQKYLTTVESDKPLYSIGTWDSDRECFSPQPHMTTPWLNVDIHGLRRHLKELKTKGYACHRRRHNGNTVNSDPSVLVERTDGRSEAAIRNYWLGRKLR